MTTKMIVQIYANTNGKGRLSDEERKVAITSIGFGYMSTTYYPEDPFNGELRAYFEPHGFTPQSWNVDAHGQICSDRLWLKEFKAGLREHGFSIKAAQNVKYSTDDMQGSNYVSLDIGPAFYASWKRLEKMVAFWGDTLYNISHEKKETV